MIVSQHPIWFGLLSLIAGSVADRMPPKLLKVTNNVGKALQAGRYSGSMVPIPPKIVLQANFARKEVHLPGRSYRRKRRPPPPPPPNRRPQIQSYQRDKHATQSRGKYRDGASGGHRGSGGGKYRSHSSSRLPYRDPEYFEQELEDVDSEMDYDFDDSPYRSYSSEHDVIHQAAEFHPSAYKSTRNKNVNHREPDESFEAMTFRKPQPMTSKKRKKIRQQVSGAQHLYSGPLYRPYYHQEDSEDSEENEFDDVPRPRKRGKLRKPGPREKHKYFDEEEYSGNFENFDNYYHDRTENTGDLGNEFDENPEENNKSERARPDFGISGLGAKASSWDELRKEEGSLRQNSDERKWSPTMEPIQQLPRLVEQPFRVIPVWHILQQFTGPKGPDHDYNGEATKTVYDWIDPKQRSNTGKYSSKMKETPSSTNVSGIVANRLVSDSIKWTPSGHLSFSGPSPSSSSSGHFPSFHNYSGEYWAATNNDNQWSVPVTNGDVIYGSRPSDKIKNRVPDIGYGQGMELLNERDEGGDWQVY